MVTVYTIAYNESALIQFMIDHYRSRFPDCRIILYDNMSTDNTVKIALGSDCEIIPFDTNNQMSDRRHMDIKNNCWKDAKTDWVLMCDADELLDINEEQLKAEENSRTSIIKPEAYNMVNMKDNFNIASIKYGVRDPNYDKCCLFNKKFIKEINYGAGAHKCDPIGTVAYNINTYKLYHYKLINENYTIEKLKTTVARLSPENIKNCWLCYSLFPYQETREIEEIRSIYADDRKNAIKLR